MHISGCDNAREVLISAKESLKDCLFNDLKFVILLTKTRWLQTKLSGEIVVEIKSFKKEPAQRAGVIINDDLLSRAEYFPKITGRTDSYPRYSETTIFKVQS